MRTLRTSALILTLSLAVSVQAQQPPPRPGQPPQPPRQPATQQGQQPDQQRMHAEAEAIELMLLRQKSVCEELKINEDEGKKIREFTEKQHQTAMETHKLPQGEQAAKWDAMRKENEEFLHTAITPDQRKRLKQIAMQEAGLLFVSSPKVAQELGLTSQQEEQVRHLQQEMQEKVTETLRANRENREVLNEKLTELRHTSHEELHKVLNDEQRAKFKEMVGEPFKGKLIIEDDK